ncbi:MAG: hypothetical protein K1X65_05985 [Caldilineales bacterium]|nr:hypothetical protein [Caldilineales bacterium]MCW5861127.1 hypothetical protein [Caldilineales bacterium]
MTCSNDRPEAPITHTNHRRDHLFIVRIWLEPGAEVRPAPVSGQLDEMGWRGSVQHVRSGRRLYFRRLADLDEFMLGWLARSGGALEPEEVEFGPAA